MATRALITIAPHDKLGPIILDENAHVLVHTDIMAVEVHICFSPVIVITEAEGTFEVDCPCGQVHEYQTPKEYLAAAERQKIQIDYTDAWDVE